MVFKRVVIPVKIHISGMRRPIIVITYNNDNNALSIRTKYNCMISNNRREITRQMLRTDLTSPVNGFDREMVDRLCEVAYVWSDNAWTYSTMKQRKCLFDGGFGRNEFIERYRRYLQQYDLEVDNGVRYGAAYRFDLIVPDEVLKWLFELPGEGSTWEEILADRPEEIVMDDFMKLLMG